MARKSKHIVALTTTPKDQCLGNPDLIDQILRFVPSTRSPANTQNLRMARKSLHSAALTSRALYHSAVKFLWQRLDNLLPLLHLLPTFKQSDRYGNYEFPGILDDAEWEVFDRHAAYVREIIYSKTWSGTVNPLVYMRLAMRKTILLPNLRRFECEGDPAGPDLVLYISPSLVSLRFGSPTASSVETYLNMLSVVDPPLSHLSIASYPNTVLSFCSLFQKLQFIDLKSLEGPVTNSAFHALGSLPLLQALTTDLTGWDKIDYDSIPAESIFCALTRLDVSANRVQLRRNIPLLLPRIGAPSMVSISIVQSYHYDRWDLTDGSAETFTAISRCIASRWPTTLSHLLIKGIPCSAEDFSTIQGATKIQTLELKQTLQDSLSDPRILAVVRTWSEITSLTVDGAEADMEFMRCLAEHCPALRVLHVAFFPDPLPEISTTPVLAHVLAELRFFRTDKDHGWRQVDAHVLARSLDRLFPQLASIVGEGHYQRWQEVDKLVRMCQDVRRTAWEQK